MIDWLENYCDLTTYEISIPVLRDSSLAPDGQTGMMVSCLFDYHVMENVYNAGWYDELKERVEIEILANLSKTIFREIESDILFKYSSTPLTINKIAGSSEGAITGWSFDSEPPVIYKLTDVGKSVFTALPNVYKAGQWAYAPAGVAHCHADQPGMPTRKSSSSQSEEPNDSQGCAAGLYPVGIFQRIGFCISFRGQKWPMRWVYLAAWEKSKQYPRNPRSDALPRLTGWRGQS